MRDGVEVKSSDESLDEEKQKKLWELTGGYAHLDGFAPLDVPPPPAEPAPEEQKTEPKAEEANGEAAKESGDTPIITDSNKTDEAKTEEKGAGEYCPQISVCIISISSAVVVYRLKLCFHVKIKLFYRISDPSRRHQSTVLIFFTSGVVPSRNEII